MNKISVKIFAGTAGVFALVLLIQWICISGSFNRLYENNLSSSMQRELDRTIETYLNTQANAAAVLSEYAQQTGSPVLVLTADGRILSSSLLEELRTITLRLPDGSSIVIPVGYLYKVYGPNAPQINNGKHIDVEVVRLGRSNYYVPLSITVDGQIYRDRSRIRKYADIPSAVHSNLLIIGSSNVRESDLQTVTRAEFIFSAAEDLLLRQNVTLPALRKLCNNTVTCDGFDYRFLCSSAEIGDTDCRFLTAQRIVVTGYEQDYLQEVFVVVYGIMGLLLVVTSLVLSRSISRPLGKLNTVAQRIAAMDFTCHADDKRCDELGTLAQSINQLSDNLQVALEDLQVSNAQLWVSSETARRNEQRMKKLLSDLAHEFKTPLGLISSYMEAIEVGLCKDPQPYFRVIEQEIEELTFMVNEAIELAKLQSGTWRIELGNHNLRDILCDVEQRFTDKLRAAGYTLAVESDNIFVTCDAHRITQVISNFISNAVKYADEQKNIRIYVTVSQGKAWIHTENSGYLDPAVIPRIWERDYGTDGISHARLPSQGIGLNIVKSILDAHHSAYHVASEKNRVTFSFSLPVVTE